MRQHLIRCFAIVLFAFFFMPQITRAHINERDVKLSGNYFWGEGFGDTRENAISNARRDLIEKMIVRVESDASLTESETDNNYSSDFKSTTQTMSRMELRGLDYLPPQERRNGTWKSVAYLSKSDFNASMKLEEERLLLNLEQALADEEAGRLGTAFAQYFDILASTYYYPTPFFTNAEDHGMDAELRAYLFSKISNWVNGLDVEVSNIRSLSTASNTELYIDLEVKYQGAAVDHLTFAINRAGYAQQPVRNGKVSIFSDINPDTRIKEYVFFVEIDLPETIDDEKKEIVKDLLPSRELALDIDFSEIIDIDFRITKENENTYSFIPQISNLAVYDVEWDFGDGNNSKQGQPTHQYAGSVDDIEVSLTLNRDKDFRVVKPIVQGRKPAPKKTVEPVKSNDQPIANDTKVAGYSIPSGHLSHITNLSKFRTLNDVNRYLLRLKNEGLIDVGGRQNVSDTKASYIIFLNPNSRVVVDILSPESDGQRFKLNGGGAVNVNEISEQYKGMGSVWFQFK